MTYGSIKVDTITYTSGGGDATSSVSGLAGAVNGIFPNITVTGTISGTTITGDTGQYTSLTSATGTFANISGVFISGSAASPSAAIGTSDNGLYSPASGQVAISTNGAGRLFVDASGNVGIGTSTPGNYPGKLVIVGDGMVCDREFNSRVAASVANAERGFMQVTDGIERLHIYADSGSDNVWEVSGTERMRITADGKVGVGTSSPSSTLTVEKNLPSDTLVSFNNTNATASSVLKLNTAGAGSGTSVLDCQVLGTSKFLVNGLGKVGVGTTSPSQELEVNGEVLASNYRLPDAGGTISGSRTVTGAAIQIFDTAQRINFNTNGSERARIDSFGRLLVGTSSGRTVGSAGVVSQIETTGGNAGLSIVRNSNTATGGFVTLAKTRGTSLGSSTIVQSGDALGGIAFAGADGADLLSIAARISAEVDGTPGANDMPGRLVFSTTADGASSPTERMRIASDGVITIANGAVATIDALADGATITPDFASACNFSITISGNRTMANPTNITAGQTGSIFITQDGTGSRTISWGSYWDFPGGTAPTLSTASGAVDRVDYMVRTTTSIHTVFTANYS